MRYITVFILSLIFWLLLTFRITVPNLIVGSVASLVCSAIFARYYFHNVNKFLQPHRYFWFIIYLFVFIWECIKANFDVASGVWPLPCRLSRELLKSGQPCNRTL